MASTGGKYGDGIIFSINTDGSAFTDLHDFTGSISDGNEPVADLALSGNTLYGMTELGGANGKGVIFSISAGGSGFTLLHSFGNSSDGVHPLSSLTINGTTLYGTTSEGGAGGHGSIFSISVSGSNYNRFYDFDGTDSYTPLAGVAVTPNDSAVYGTASQGGGLNNDGVVYSVLTNGAMYRNLVVFSGANGTKPEGSLVLSGNTLYGMANAGGKNNIGDIFSFNTKTSTFKDMLNFNGGNGASPEGALIMNGTTMYGMTNAGGEYLLGNIFTISTADTAYMNIYNLGAGTYGSYPQGALVISNNVLYGMTPYGGKNNNGTIFSCSF